MIPCFCCASELYCGCKSCAEKNTGQHKFIVHGNNATCSVCGYTAQYAVWMEMEYELYMRFRDEEVKPTTG